MCQARPAQLTRIEGSDGWIVLQGHEQPVSLVAVPGVSVGDYVICHAGFALERLEPAEAEAILAVLAKLELLGHAVIEPEMAR
jgi:hydrogenase expression/formation protein HypC